MDAPSLGKYRLLRPLATGGMGEVFLAEQEGPSSFRRRVVVKRLLRHLASDPAFVEMFVEEARLAALIAHPNVVQIIELGEAEGTFFLAMEHVRGKSLREVLRVRRSQGERIPALVAVAIMIGVLHGLNAAHTLVDEAGNARGCVHRDVSAENVLLSVDGAVKLVDFGIAKALSASTARGTKLRGKYGYMAPEQYRHARLDARTDIFAAGVLLFELVAGERPFVADHEAGIMHAIIHDPAPSLADVVGTPRSLDAIVGRALAKDPADRFASAEAMARALEELVASGELGASDTGGALRDFARTLAEELSDSASDGAGTPRVPGTEALPAPFSLVVEDTVIDPVGPTSGGRRRSARIAVTAVVLVLVIASVLVVASSRRAGPPPAPATTLASSATTSSSAPPEVEPGPPPSGTIAAPEAHDVDAGRQRRAADRPARRGPAVADKTAGVGTLAFRIRPWAEIFVDGRSVGISPVSPVELPAGRHSVLLRNKNLEKERTLTTQIVRGETTTLRVDLMAD